MPNVTGFYNPERVPGERGRTQMLNDFGIKMDTSYRPLHGKIWRICAMGYNRRKSSILAYLAALEALLRQNGYEGASTGEGVDEATRIYHLAGD